MIDMSKRFVPILLVVTVVLAFFVGILWQKVQNLEKSGKTAVKTAGGSPLGLDNLKKYAKELKLDTKKFNSCLDEGKMEQKVKNELSYGESFGVTGTPAFFINGMLLGGAYPYETFKAVIDFELKGGDWEKPDSSVKLLVDGDVDNGEIVLDRKEVDLAGSPTKGESSAKVKIVEFSDFECPYCVRFYSQTFDRIQKEYVDTGKILFAYKQFPLSFHQNAQKAAEASLCAGEQGRFWEYHNSLFTTSSNPQ